MSEIFGIAAETSVSEQEIASGINDIKYATPTSEEKVFRWGRCHGGVILGGWIMKKECLKEDGIRVCIFGDYYCDDSSICRYIKKCYLHKEKFGWIEKISGKFIILIENVKKNEVLVANDRHGLISPYWSLQNGKLAWSSSLSSFWGLEDFRCTMDGQSIVNFVESGYHQGQDTWFREVNMMPPASVLSWKLGSKNIKMTRYWEWDDVHQLSNFDEGEILNGLATRFDQSVRRRCQGAEKPGVYLSGGLDSRAIFAAMPKEAEPIPALTFGQRGSEDIRTAAEVVRLRSSNHRKFFLDSENWFEPRLRGIWWTDGEMSLLHMHGIEALGSGVKDFMDVALNGYLGDATIGGSYISSSGDEKRKIMNRGRRFILNGPKIIGKYIPCRLPFFDYAFMDLAMSMPKSVKYKRRLYKKLLMEKYERFFDYIPKTGEYYPITKNPENIFSNTYWKIVKKIKYGSKSYSNYEYWVKSEKFVRWVEEKLLSSPIVNDLKVGLNIVSQWEKFKKQEKGLQKIGRLITLEVYLRQLTDRNFRKRSVEGGDTSRVVAEL